MTAREDIEVLVEHPHGPTWVPLDEWIRTGPGPRELLRPVQARDRRGQRALPLSVVPLAYRNSLVSRTLVRLRLLARPWSQPR